jgi:hypothetical protein
VIPPNVSHAACDLDQQRRLHQARRDSLVRAAAIRCGRSSLLDRLLRRPPRDLTGEDGLRDPVEDVFHGLRGCSLSRW